MSFPVLRTAVFACIVLALGSGCPRSRVPPGPDAGVTVTACFDDSDCPDPRLFVCSPSTFTCQPACRVASDCNAEARQSFPLAFCAGLLGCHCDQGECVKALCSADGDCPAGGICRNGECTAIPSPAAVARCAVVPDVVVMKEGTVRTLRVLAEDAQGEPWTPAAGQVSWRASDAGALDGERTGPEVRLVAGAGAAEVVAEVGPARCAASLQVVPVAVPPGQLRALVTDALTGRPLEGVTVRATADAPDAGAGPLAEGATDASGIALLPLDGQTAAFSVSAFQPGYAYLTYAGVDLSGLRDVRLALRRDPVLHGGFSGTFSEVPASEFVHAGLAGLSPADPISEVTPQRLFGPAVPSPLRLGTSVQQAAFPLPEGMFVGVGTSRSKDTVRAEGDPGICTRSPDGATAVEEAIRAGRCGTRTGWALSADLPLGALPLDLLATDPELLGFGALLPRGAPLARGLNSTVRRDVVFGLEPSSTGVPAGGTLLADAGFSPTFATPPNVPAAIALVVDVPTLPGFAGRPLDGLVLLGEALVPGRGQVVLGLGGAVSSTGQALPDLQAGMPRQGLVPLRMAPTHHGLEGTPYVIQAMAVQLHPDSAVGLAASALLARPPGNALRFDPEGRAPLGLAGPFLPLASEAAYDPEPGADGEGRRIRAGLEGSAAASATAVELAFTDADGLGWTVVADPGRLATGIRVPLPPAGFADRSRFQGGAVPADLSVRLLALDAQPATGTAPLDFRMVTENTGTNLDRQADLVRAYSVVEFPHPQLGFVSPAEDSVVPRQAQVTVQLRGFRLGQGNAVRFDACGQSAQVGADPSLGRGRVSWTLPAVCPGEIVVSATLVRSGGPLLPAVAASLRLRVE